MVYKMLFVIMDNYVSTHSKISNPSLHSIGWYGIGIKTEWV